MSGLKGFCSLFSFSIFAPSFYGLPFCPPNFDHFSPREYLHHPKMGNKHSEHHNHHHGQQGPSSSPNAQSPVPIHQNLNGGDGFLMNGTANKGGTWRGRANGTVERNSRLSSPPLPPSSSAASSSSTALPSNANNTSTLNKSNNSTNSSKPCTPRADNEGGMGARKGGGGGFLAQLFNGGTLGRKTEKKAAQPNSTPQSQLIATNPPPTTPDHLGGGGQHFDILTDRPAIRLDSRLVCKYEVLSVVGKGSFSQVLRVQDRITKRYYAVKLVSTDQDFGAVNNELTILGRVKHPFVIRLEEVFRSATKLFIVMEMASGGEMYDRVVAKGRYTESEARLAIKMLLTGLDYLHTNLITHRDLKPENLLYSDNRPDARLLITDFGLAHQARVSDEKMAETCGTPEYIAPEILLRIPYSNKVDCWAVGVIAYILMSGIMPFDDDCRSRLYTHIITANYVYYPQFWSGSDQAKHFVDCLLETSSEHRPTAREALHHHWVTGERPKGLSRREKAPRRDWAFKGVEDGGTTVIGDNNDADEDAESNVNGTTVQRTKSSRSIRSVTRSDHGHRVDPREVDQLAEDLQRLAKQRHNNNYHHGHGGQNGHGHHQRHMNGHAGNHHRPPSSNAGKGPQPYANGQITKNYGVF